MHFPQLPRIEAAFVLSLLVSSAAAATTFDCSHVRVDDVSFNLESLKGPHSVITSKWHPPTFTNTSYTVDICAPLKRKGDVKKEDECPNGTRVCAIQRTIHPGKDIKDDIEKVIPIAGELGNHGGRSLDVKAERLKSSDSNSDAKKEGVRLILNGGSYPLGRSGRNQKAIIEFLCDREKSGLEGEVKPEDQYDGSQFRAREDEKEKDKDKEGDGNGDDLSPDETQIKTPETALIWNSYGPAEKDDVDVLRLTWHTKAACEDAFGKPPSDGGSGDVSSHWGFFTWFVVLAFLGIAAYLIFGSWLNYNRYGARGWDLLPHGDTIRDIPYLVKDWTRSVLNTVNGSGSRGGYSAV
ncbi:Autophagy-related protein 27 [Colletotrichum chlorophyti]|uniref:Autophagy-related protein 27 n=1 Tax=Colletotrichum chlorophyti TaxID=708187 RepID=A0A1Q8S1B9_9PEZI|nr:Autophagy-related protein 27 [Colletotrichum chlorophyti]